MKHNTRSILLQKNIVASFLVKGWSAIVVLMMLPLTLNCLGSYQNGVWLTISSLLVWIDQMDIGLGNGMRNSLAVNVAHFDYDKAREVVSSTVAMLSLIVFPLCMAMVILVWNVDVYSFLNVIPEAIPELRIAITSAVILVCMTFVMKFIGNVYMGMQLPAISNGLLALGQTLAFILTWILYKCDKATFTNVVVVNTISPLITYVASYPYTFYKKFYYLRPGLSYVNLNTAFKLGNLGVKFFWLQIAALIQFFTTNIIISKFFTPEMVTPYQISYRYLSLMLVVFNVVCMPYWNATTDAYEKNDIEWIKEASKKMHTFSLVIFLGLVIMTLVSPFVYSVWIGSDTIVPFPMTCMMALYIFLVIFSTRYSYFLNGIGTLGMQLRLTISAVLFVPCAWFVCYLTNSIIGLMAVMCILNLPAIVIYIIQFKKIINGKANGIWKE